MRRERKRRLFRFLISVTVSLLVLLVTMTFVIRPAIIESDFMEPTIQKDQFVLVNVLNRTRQDYHRFDIVCAKIREINIMKRLIGLPGETVKYHEGQLYINGTPQTESFFKNNENTQTKNLEITLGEDQYLIVGDNRGFNDNFYNIINEEQIISAGIIFPEVE